METIRMKNYKAWISVDESGISIDYNSGRFFERHYDVEVFKDGDLYIVKATKPEFEYFMDREYSEEVLSNISMLDITNEKPSWLNWFKGKRYAKGYCELKNKTKKTYTSNNITIIQND